MSKRFTGMLILAILLAALSITASASADNPPLLTYAAMSGNRSVEVTFRVGHEPLFNYTGNADGSHMSAFFGNEQTGYAWRYIWNSGEKAPTFSWQREPRP